MNVSCPEGKETFDDDETKDEARESEATEAT